MSRRTLLGGAISLAACERAGADNRERGSDQGERRGPRLLTGVNLAGLEFNGGRQPGQFQKDYTTPRAIDFTYYRACGARVVRLPFLWERAQPELEGPLDRDYIAHLDEAVETARASDMRIVLDAHQYGRRRVEGQQVVIGETGAVTAEHFAGFWAQIADRYRHHRHVIFNLTNEPHDQDMATLVAMQNHVTAAIRETRADQLILASGNAWSGAHSWERSGNAEAMLGVRDPGDNLAFDVHQYLDRDSSGRANECVEGAGGRRLNLFTEWARSNGRRGFLGEFGVGRGANCESGLTDLLEHMSANREAWIGWTYWAGGPWWPENYPLSITPISLEDPVDRPQMQVLRRYFE